MQAYQDTNPNYALGGGYQRNCQRCVPTAEARRRGYDVEALPRQQSYNGKQNACEFGYECFENPVIVGYFGNKKGIRVSKRQMITELNQFPDGSRFGIIWIWSRSNSGHTIVCEKINGKLEFFDPQNGQKLLIANLKKYSTGIGFTYYRMDNLKFNQNFDLTQVMKKK